jgi:hypothetical protein
MTQEQDTARKIVDILEQGASELDAATCGKLAGVRQQAVAAMAEAVPVAQVKTAHAGVGSLITEHLHGHRAWVPMALLLAATLLLFVVMQQQSAREPVEADALLLASELPPEAYLDKGFDAWLENSSQL